jgi:hypothetical protein
VESSRGLSSPLRAPHVCPSQLRKEGPTGSMDPPRGSTGDGLVLKEQVRHKQGTWPSLMQLDWRLWHSGLHVGPEATATIPQAGYSDPRKAEKVCEKPPLFN